MVLYQTKRARDYQHELGIVNARFVPGDHAEKVAGTLVYWHVDDGVMYNQHYLDVLDARSQV